MDLPIQADPLSAAHAGDRQALERLLGLQRRRVVRYAERHCAVHDVEDAVQETLLIAARRLHTKPPLRVISPAPSHSD